MHLTHSPIINTTKKIHCLSPYACSYLIHVGGFLLLCLLARACEFLSTHEFKCFENYLSTPPLLSSPRLATVATAKSNTLRKAQQEAKCGLCCWCQCGGSRPRGQRGRGRAWPHCWWFKSPPASTGDLASFEGFSKVEPACSALFSAPLMDLEDSVAKPSLTPGYCTAAALLILLCVAETQRNNFPPQGIRPVT